MRAGGWGGSLFRIRARATMGPGPTSARGGRLFLSDG